MTKTQSKAKALPAEPSGAQVRSSAGLDDAIQILINISKEYQRF